MSQYPVPYSTPQPYMHDPYGVYLGPARRAGALMMVLGALGLTCAACLILVVLFAPMQSLIAQSGVSIPSAAEVGMQPETFMRVMYGMLAGASIVVSLLLLILAIFVRRGSSVAIITSIVIDSLIILFLILNLLTSLVQILRSPGMVIGLLLVLVLLGSFVLLMVWLIQAIKATSALRAAQTQYQQQYWQYQQQQQMYGYGYAQQQPPHSSTPSEHQKPPQSENPPEHPISPR
jgi:hypothetical protein